MNNTMHITLSLTIYTEMHIYSVLCLCGSLRGNAHAARHTGLKYSYLPNTVNERVWLNTPEFALVT